MLTEKAQNREVVAIAPSTDVVLKSLKVPGKSNTAIRQATPYMLEEDLAQDVEQLFFAYANVKSDADGDNCFTAIVAQQQMRKWLDWLNAANLVCRKMVPEALLLPHHDKEWTAVAINQQIIVRQGIWQGFTLDESQWPLFANQWQQLDPVPTIRHYSPLTELPASIETIAEPEELPLVLMANQPLPVNLLQGKFAVKTQRSPAVKYWLSAAGLVLFALLLQLGLKGAELYQLNTAQQQVEQDIIASYKKAFPQTKRVRISTIKSQLRRKLAESGVGGESAGFLPMLAKLQTAFEQVPAMQTQSIKFDGKRQEIRLQAQAKDYQSFDKFKSVLERTQLQVTQGTQNNQGTSITGSFSIKEL